MRTNDTAPTAALSAALDALAAQDPASLPACSVRRDLRELLTATNRLHAELVRRVAAFDATRSSGADGYRTTRAWLRVFGRLSHAGATRLVRAARLLGGLPRLADAAAKGAVSAEHVYRVDRLAEEVGLAAVRPVEAALAELASWVDPTVLGRACARVHRPTGVGRDAGAEFDRRGITLSPLGGTILVRGQLDPAGAAAVRAALDALMRTAARGDERLPAQRRADALVELARQAMRQGRLPWAPGPPPQVALRLSPDNLITPEDLPAPPEDAPPAEDPPSQGEGLAECDRPGGRGGPGWAGARLGRRPSSRPGAIRPRPPGPPGTTAPAAFGASVTNRPGILRRLAGLAPGGPRPMPWPDPPPARRIARRAAPSARPDEPDGPRPDRSDIRRDVGPDGHESAGVWLRGVGEVPDEVGRRLACDADIREVMFDPVSGWTTNLDGPHRVVPDSLRKALYARDAGCVFPGCDLPPEWTDAHFLRSWANGGRTDLANIVLLCRHHHGFVHEGGWTITRETATGVLEARRPDGGRFKLFDPPPA
jgi:hypothetical protein